MDELLKEARSYLDITWEDPAGDAKLSGILERGKSYLDRIAGCKLDYTVESQARALLLDYARYVRSHALNEFAGNYQHELIALQADEEVRRNGAAKL